MSPEDVRDLLADHALGLLPAEEAARVEAALSASPELRRDAEALRGALYAVPLTLEPEPPAPGAWHALRRRTRGEAPTPGPAARRRRPALALALAACVALLAGSVGWGALQHRSAALRAHEQAVVAYWMRVPGMRVVPLQAADGAVAGVHPGVVCLLPDGRAMALQPHPAPQDGNYVLYGDTGTGRVELGSTRGTLIEFRADGLHAVELAIPGPRGGVVARAPLP